MANGSGYSGGRSSASSRGSSSRPASVGRSAPARRSSSSRTVANSRMWSQPATPKQIDALKATSSFDGKYYSMGRAGQAIGKDVQSNRSADTQLNLLKDAILDQITSLKPLHRVAPTASPTEASREVTIAAHPDHNVVLEEGTTMSQLVPVRTAAPAHNIAAIVEHSAAEPSQATPFSYLSELVNTLLKPLVTTTEPSQVRALERALTIAKGSLAKSLAQARNQLVSVLWEAPTGTFASAEATADELLWNACSADLEDQLLMVTQKASGRTRPSKVIDEILAQVTHRVDLALIEARDIVDVAKIQAALPPTPSRGYEPCWGEVTGVREFGVFVRLANGECGLLHRTQLHPLNGGRDVHNAASFFNVGQPVFVRVASKNEKGQLNFALAKEVVA